MKDYAIENRTPFHTAGELRQLLSNLADNAPVFICGTDGWFHAPEDFSYACLDDTTLYDCYPEDDGSVWDHPWRYATYEDI